MAGAVQNEFRNKLNNKLLGLTLEMTDEAVITLNKSARIIQVNEVTKKLFAGFCKNLLGLSIDKILGNQPLVKTALQNGKPVLDSLIECEILKQKFFCSIKPLIDSGVNYGYLVTLSKPGVFKKIANPTAGANARFTFSKIIGSTPEMSEVIEHARKFARLEDSILIQGESGTGKEVFAQAIHNESRPCGPFIAVNCGAIAKSLIESELFGYEKGAFTGAERQGRAGKIEMAHRGTLFLDEIGDLPLELQSVLLRVIEEKQVIRIGGTRYIDVDFRLIVARTKT
jgi:transcriptional regulator with PAS, ATPase and Fis domain